MENTIIASTISKIRGKHECREFMKQWQSLFAKDLLNTDRHGKFITSNLVKTSYGWNFELVSLNQIDTDVIEEIRNVIEYKLECMILIEHGEDKNVLECRLIYNSVIEEYRDSQYKPVKVHPYELCGGVGINGEPLIIDTRENSNTFLFGGCRTGKSGALDNMINNLLESCDDVDLYLLQATHKDLGRYKQNRQVKEYISGDIGRMDEVLTDIEKELNRRILIDREGNGEDRLNHIYVVVDDLLGIQISDVENSIVDKISKLGAVGRAYGIHLVIVANKLLKNKTGDIYKLCENKLLFKYYYKEEGLIDTRHIQYRVAYYTCGDKLDILVVPSVRAYEKSK